MESEQLKHWAVYTAAMPQNNQNILEIDIPEESRILSFGKFEKNLVVRFLAPVDKEAKLKIHKFYLLKDGGMVCEGNMNESKFIGSVAFDGNDWHCFQL